MTVVQAPSPTDLTSVVEEVWSTFLGFDEPLVPDFSGRRYAIPVRGGWSAVVTVAGGWQGTVRVDLAHPVATALTRRMMHTPGPAEPDAVDVMDAVGELVNVVGGNVKSLMPGPSALSLPEVGRPVPPDSGSQVACQLDFTWAGHPVSVTVLVPDSTLEHA